MERRLTAILSTDVKGYSRLMSEDEELTIRTLIAYRAVMATLIEQHRGRVVDAPGDNLLAEFASVVDAVQSALAIQRGWCYRSVLALKSMPRYPFLLKGEAMALIPVRCPYCQSEQVIKGGKTDTGKQRYRCHNPDCPHQSFRLCQNSPRQRVGTTATSLCDLIYAVTKQVNSTILQTV